MNTRPVVMILAAGRGSRMAPLTDHCPKPLLQAGPHRLIEHHLYRLAEHGFSKVIINTAWQGHMIPEALGNGERYGLDISYSHEQALGLETAGGIINALPLLGNDPFIVINGDVWTDYPFEKLQLPTGQLGHLVLVKNPGHNSQGDFGLKQQQVTRSGDTPYTFSGIGIYHPDLFKGLEPGFRPLREPLFTAIENNTLSGEYYAGDWQDIGTPERLQALDETLAVPVK